MEDRKASMVAAAFGGVAIGGFWLARPVGVAAPLRVSEQWTPIVRQAVDTDLAAGFRVETHPTVRAAREAGQNVDYRIIDGSGVAISLIPMSDGAGSDVLKLIRGYPRAIRSPRLAAYANGELLTSAPVAALPPPESVPLLPRPNDDVALVYHPGGGIYAEAKHPVGRLERWRVFARRTPHNGQLDTFATLGPRPDRFSTRRFSIPYPAEVDSVEIDLVRYRLAARSDLVRIPNLRLARRMGGTAMIVDHRTVVPNRLGVTIVLPTQDNGPRRPIRHEDPRMAFASIVVQSEHPADLGSAKPPEGSEVGPFLEIVSPAPESLGLNELRIGSADRLAKRQPPAELRTGPFSAVLRVTYYRPIPVAKTHTVLPVSLGKPVPRPRFFGVTPNPNEF